MTTNPITVNTLPDAEGVAIIYGGSEFQAILQPDGLVLAVGRHGSTHPTFTYLIDIEDTSAPVRAELLAATDQLDLIREIIDRKDTRTHGRYERKVSLIRDVLNGAR